MENTIIDDEKFQMFCLAKKFQDEKECDMQKGYLSLVNHLLGNSTLNQTQLELNFKNLVSSPMWYMFKGLVDKDVSASNLRIRYMRSIFF